VILLDLDLPVVDGRRVLTEVEADAALRVIPVIVLSGSTAPDDLFCACSLGANVYVSKPIRLRPLRRAIRAIYQLWCVAAARPEAR
jgi:DNA-binding response OmpR family regulator